MVDGSKGDAKPVVPEIDEANFLRISYSSWSDVVKNAPSWLREKRGGYPRAELEMLLNCYPWRKVLDRAVEKGLEMIRRHRP